MTRQFLRIEYSKLYTNALTIGNTGGKKFEISNILPCSLTTFCPLLYSVHVLGQPGQFYCI